MPGSFFNTSETFFPDALNDPLAPPTAPAGKDGNYKRDADGTFVPTNRNYSTTRWAAIWRWPTKLLPDNPPDALIPATPWLVYGIVAALIVRRFLK